MIEPPHRCHLGQPQDEPVCVDEHPRLSRHLGLAVGASLLLTVLLWSASCSRIVVTPPGQTSLSPVPALTDAAIPPPAVSGIAPVVIASPVPVDEITLALQREKLVLENAKLRNDLDWLGRGANLASIVTPIAAIGALLWTVISFHQTRSSDQEKRLAEMLEDRFTSAVDQLGGNERGAQVGAAALLRFFLRNEPRFLDYHRPVFNIATAQLRLQSRPVPGDTTPDPLIRELGHVLRLACPLARAQRPQVRGDALLDATHVRLPYAHLVNADLRDIRMTHAYLQGAELSGANLADAHLMQTNFSGAMLNQARLCRTKLMRIRAVAYGRPDGHFEANFANACFWQADLTGAVLTAANLNNAKLQSATLASAILDDASLQQADLSGATLTAAHCESAQFVGARFDGATLTTADLREANLTGANIHEAETLLGTILIDVIGLDDPNHRAICRAKGAILN